MKRNEPFIILYPHPSAYPPPPSSLTYTVGTCPTCHRDAFEVTTHGDREPVYLCWFCETGKAANVCTACGGSEKIVCAGCDGASRNGGGCAGCHGRGYIICRRCNGTSHPPAATGPTQRLTPQRDTCEDDYVRMLDTFGNFDADHLATLSGSDRLYVNTLIASYDVLAQIARLTASVTEPAATGPTQRLTRHCNACADALPPGAAFCIGCGARVEEPV